MEARRVRRALRGRRPRSELPIRRDSAAAAAPSWRRCYCDVKIFALNQPLFRLGSRRAASLRRWFAAGVGFGLSALLAVSLILVWELARALRILPPNPLGDLSSSLLFGFSPVSAFGVSLADIGCLMVSTLISVGFHEFGHALAAASEGIQMDYIAIFIFVLFPGALVAFNYEVLEAVTPFASLRVYCAGIWHNAVLCAICGLVLFLMPFVLFPFYEQAGSPMVLAVPSASPISPYLSPGDVIVSLDGIHINSAHEWMEMAALLNELALQNVNNTTHVESVGSINSKKGYCVPDSVLEESKKIEALGNQSGCVDDLASFVSVPCSGASTFDDDRPKRVLQTHCLNAKEVVKFGKCGHGWMMSKTDGDSCICSQDELCLSPIQKPGMVWVEVSYSSPYSKGCSQTQRKPLLDSRVSDSKEPSCGGSFVFVGDVIFMAGSVQLTMYQPRWKYFSSYIPHVLERVSLCTFHVSLTLALLNSLPVYFLDGESIIEVTLCHLTPLSPSKSRKLLRIWLLAGNLISSLAFFRVFLKFVVQSPRKSFISSLEKTSIFASIRKILQRCLH